MTLPSGQRPHPTVRALTALAVSVTGLSLVTLAPSSAAAAPASPVCATSGADLTCTVTFGSVGAEESYVVPDGVERLDVTAVGGAGGSFYDLAGGRPAVVNAGLDVTAGTTYYVAVAGNGGWGAGGWNGGGVGSLSDGARGGGGASDLRTLARTEPGTLDSRVLVAGGGGGADIWVGGGNAGLNGDAGPAASGTQAGGGTQTQGGAGANWFNFYIGGNGAQGQGGNGDGRTVSGGGGGGGLYGGGGGAYDSGGGGGSSLVPSGGTAAADYSGQAPQIRISRTLPIIAATGLTPDATTTRAGTTSASYSVAVTDGLDTASAAPGRLVISPRGPDTGATCTATACSATRAGTYTVIGSYAGFTADTTLTVAPAPAATLTVTPTNATATAGVATAYTVSAHDSYGNLIADESDTTTVTLVPVGGGDAQACSQDVCSPTTAGDYTVRAHRPASGGAGALTATTALSVTPARLATLRLSPDVSDSTAGAAVAYTATGADAFGNSLGDQTATSTVTMSRTDGAGDPVACPDAVCTPQASGTYRVTATQGDVVDSAALNVAASGATLTLGATGEVTFGDDVPTSATVAGDAQGSAPTGTVQFLLDGDEVGAPVPVPGDGQVTGPVLSGLTGGMHTLAARFASEPDGAFASAPAQNAFVVAQAPTTTEVAVAAGSLTATVDGGTAGVPAGEVDFAVDGRAVGSASLVDGVATLDGDTLGGADSVVAAAYAGSRDFAASSGSTARRDPTIVASLSSTSEAQNGWYVGPVTVSFTCTEGSAPVTCPEPVVVDTEGAAQSVTRTVTAEDGGVATVTAGPVNIDLTAPTVRVGRVVSGETYNGKAPVARCVGADAASGVTSCTVTTTRADYPGPVTSTATATDLAGHSTTETVTYQERDLWVSASQLRRTAWDVPAGERARVHVVSAGRPLLIGGPATGRFQFVERMLGRGHWRGSLALPDETRPGTVLEVRIGTGDGPRLLRLRVVG